MPVSLDFEKRGGGEQQSTASNYTALNALLGQTILDEVQEIVLPEGRIMLPAAAINLITTVRGRLILRGSGNLGTLLQFEAATDDFTAFQVGSATDLTLVNLRVYAAASAPASGKRLRLVNLEGGTLRMQDVETRYWLQAWKASFDTSTELIGPKVQMRNCTVQSRSHCLHVSGADRSTDLTTNYLRVDGCTFSAETDADPGLAGLDHDIYADPGSNLFIASTRFASAPGTGFAIHINGHSTDAGAPNAPSIRDCTFESGCYGGVLTNEVRRTHISGCTFYYMSKGVAARAGGVSLSGCHFRSSGAGGYAVGDYETVDGGLTATNCTFEGRATSGGSYQNDYHIHRDKNVAAPWLFKACDFSGAAVVQYGIDVNTALADVRLSECRTHDIDHELVRGNAGILRLYRHDDTTGQVIAFPNPASGAGLYTGDVTVESRQPLSDVVVQCADPTGSGHDLYLRGSVRVRAPRTGWTSAATSQSRLMGKVPDGERLLHTMLDVSVALAGTPTTLQAQAGTTSGDSDLVLAGDVKSAAVLLGDTSDEQGSVFTSGSAIASPTPVWVTLTGSSNLGNGSATFISSGTMDVLVETERLP